MRRVSLLLVLVLGCAAALASTAGASQLIDRNASHVRLSIDTKGEALLTYTAGGKLHHVLAWGAVNAIAPTHARPQVAFKLDYAGGWGKYHKNYWQTFKGSCGAYDGPPLAWEVVACKAPDGSYWAVQSWQRGLPDYGVTPTAAESAWELRLSHWTGSLPTLTIHMGWAWAQWDRLFGSYTYAGSPVFGFHASSVGNPLDSFGRNVYVDTFDSAYGKGWRRENSFLTHTNLGTFCYSFNPHGAHPSGKGTKYRATVEGPGVAPDVMWQGTPLGAFAKTAAATPDAEVAALHDPKCRPNN